MHETQDRGSKKQREPIRHHDDDSDHREQLEGEFHRSMVEQIAYVTQVNAIEEDSRHRQYEDTSMDLICQPDKREDSSIEFHAIQPTGNIAGGFMGNRISQKD